MDHCTLLQKRQFLTTTTKSSAFTLQRLHLVISKIDHCTILKKKQFHTTNNMTTKSSICIWRLVKWITAQFYKKDNFSRRRNTTTKLTKTCVKPVQNLYFFLVQTNLDAQKAPLVQSISRFQQVLLPFYVGTHTDPTLVGSTEDSTCHNSKPSH